VNNRLIVPLSPWKSFHYQDRDANCNNFEEIKINYIIIKYEINIKCSENSIENSLIYQFKLLSGSSSDGRVVKNGIMSDKKL
jgi:hypothetical protein